jgi:hypothetical protein
MKSYLYFNLFYLSIKQKNQKLSSNNFLTKNIKKNVFTNFPTAVYIKNEFTQIGKHTHFRFEVLYPK